LANFPVIWTHLFYRFHLAVDSLGLGRSGSSSQSIDQAQDFPKQVMGHSDFRHLERDVATMRQTASSACITNFRKWLFPDVTR
jgi:hypothetical protein